MNKRVASKSFALRSAPLTWLNLVCLDAPLVAISWQWLFAHAFGISIAAPNRWALFLTAWLIYLADRFGDSLRIDPLVPSSLRQRFCLRYRRAWLVAAIAVFAADAFVVLQWLDASTLRLGAQIGGVAFFYLVVNQTAPALWRRLPLKEITIGTLFAAGTVVGLAESLPAHAWIAWLLFAGLCALNCISIAIWEREIDKAQQRSSIATAFPIQPYLLPALTLLALASLVLGAFGVGTPVVVGCVAGSAALLAGLHVLRDKIQADLRTALADLVLLAPTLLCLGSACL